MQKKTKRRIFTFVQILKKDKKERKCWAWGTSTYDIDPTNICIQDPRGIGSKLSKCVSICLVFIHSLVLPLWNRNVLFVNTSINIYGL